MPGGTQTLSTALCISCWCLKVLLIGSTPISGPLAAFMAQEQGRGLMAWAALSRGWL